MCCWQKVRNLDRLSSVGNCTGSPNRSKPPSACAALDLSTLTPGVEGAGSVARVSSGSQWLGRWGSSDKQGASGVRVVTGQPWTRQGLKMVRTVSTQSAAPECWSPVHSRNKCKTSPVGRFRSHSSHFIKTLASQADAFLEGFHLVDMIVYDEDLRGHHHRPWQHGIPRHCCAIAPSGQPAGGRISIWQRLTQLQSLFIRTSALAAAGPSATME